MSPLSRQWSLRRSGGTTDGGASRIKECFRLHLNAVASGVTIVQVCVVNHTDAANYRPPHMHLQILFSDSSRSQWVQLNQVTLPQLQQTLAELPAAPNGQQPQLHLHEAEPVSQGVERAVQERLPRHELTAAEAEMWADSGRQCPICLVRMPALPRAPARRPSSHLACARAGRLFGRGRRDVPAVLGRAHVSHQLPDAMARDRLDMPDVPEKLAHRQGPEPRRADGGRGESNRRARPAPARLAVPLGKLDRSASTLPLPHFPLPPSFAEHLEPTVSPANLF